MNNLDTPSPKLKSFVIIYLFLLRDIINGQFQVIL